MQSSQIVFDKYDELANQLKTGYWAWADPHGIPPRWVLNDSRELTVDLTGLTMDGQRLAMAALASWETVSGIHFRSVASGANITFADDQSGAFTQFSAYGANAPVTVNISTDWLNWYGVDYASYSYQTYIHEIGHALGLGHAGNYNGTATYGVNSVSDIDSWQASVMSYFAQDENPNIHGSFAFVMTPMVADIIAIQGLYGWYGTHFGDDRYVFGNTGAVPTAQTILDSGGNDTFDFSAVVYDQYIDLHDRSYSDVGGLAGNIGIGPGTVIENVIGGSGRDIVIGNDADNRIEGRGGNDIVDGGNGIDTAVFNVRASDTLLFRFQEGAIASSRALGNDEVVNVEKLAFLDQTIQLNLGGAPSIFQYGASYTDLIRAFGTNGQALFQHYADYGINEGRKVLFDAQLYLGGYRDLRQAFGLDIQAASKHFISYGYAEGRSYNEFNGLEYIASYTDLAKAFGTNAAAGLAHFRQYGFNEGRGDNFDALQYIASYTDLIDAFHADRKAGAEHFIKYGMSEGRHAMFDAYAYLHAHGNEDLLAVFGGNLQSAELHFINYGYHEGRLLA